jgi:predicted branched-subunit amino acid permease
MSDATRHALRQDEPAAPVASGAPDTWALARHGAIAMLPLWAAAIPAGIAYGVAARGAGLSLAETQLMSLVVFSAVAQFSAVTLLAGGTALPVIVGTAMALNAQLLMLGLAVGRQLRPVWSVRLLSAWFLTDAAYGVAAARGPLRLPVLLGAGVSMYLAWNLGTALGAVAGHVVPDARRLSLDFVATLAFLAVLVPLVRSHAAGLAVLVAGVATLPLLPLLPGGIAVLGAGIAGSAAGALWTRRGRATDAGGA